MCKIINVKQREMTFNLEAKETPQATPNYATNYAKIYAHLFINF
jgi:hypothetical protein